MLKIKKGAMFGLDARIALAIFGALSVISGAALYSAIQESKVTALVTELTEISKAYEQYYIDTGGHMQTSVHGSCCLEIYELTESSKHGWKGPYFTFSKSNGDGKYFAQHKNPYQNYTTVTYQKRDKDFTACTATDCYVWYELYGFLPEDAAKAAKMHFDGTDDENHVGRVKIGKIGEGNWVLRLKIMNAL